MNEISEYVGQILGTKSNGFTKKVKVDDNGNLIIKLLDNTEVVVSFQELTNILGEVNDNPTANTLLARLKNLEDKVNAIINTDGVKKINDVVNVKLTETDATLAITDVITFEQFKETLDLNESYAYRTMTLSDNPGSGQMLSFGDGNIGLSFEYTDDILTYAGMNIPIQIGINPTETQVNTVIAFEEFMGPKPNVVITSNNEVLTVTSNIMGSEGFVGIGAPAMVGTASELFVGKDKVTLRNLAVRLIGIVLEEQLTNADAVNNVLTFSKNITNIEIFHNEATWQEFIVNGLTLTIPSGGYRTAVGGTLGLTVGIPIGINCIVGRLV